MLKNKFNNIYWNMKNIYKYFNFFKNPISILLFKIGIKKKCKIRFKDSNIKDYIINKNDIYLLNSYVNFRNILNPEKYEEFCEFYNQAISKCNTITIDKITFLNNESIAILFEIFEKSYSWDYTTFENRTIIDIGANIGDTALYFANKNAEKVFAFEPVPPVYNIAVKNLKLNPELSNKIMIYNKAVSFKNGEIEIKYNDLMSSGTSSEYNLNDEYKTYKVKCVSLIDFMQSNNIPFDILKIDCEGCEYPLILNTNLSNFKDVILEYHGKIVGTSHKVLVDKLENDGFSVDVYPLSEKDDLGIIHAHL